MADRPPLAGGRPARPWPGAATAFAGVVGDPVGHSLSPLLHNAGYAALGLDLAYGAFSVRPGRLPEAVAGARALGLVGFSVTMPHKEAAAELAEESSPVVRLLGAANTLVFRGGTVRAESTDGAGLLDDLRTTWGFDPAGQRAVVLGAGGAARAIVLALSEAGAEVVVVNRTASRAERAAALAGRRGRVGSPGDLAGAALVVQATPAGMVEGPAGTTEEDQGAAGSPDPMEPERLGAACGRGQLVVDLVYAPPVTTFLAAAGAAGARTRNGLGMLVHQAAHQFLLFTGEPAPLGAMWAALGEVGAGEGGAVQAAEAPRR